MSDLTREDLRALGDDLKEYVRERTDHIEQRLGDRLDGIDRHLTFLNSKTERNIIDIATLSCASRTLGQGVFGCRDSDRTPDLLAGPTWKMLGIGITAIVSIGWGVIEVVLWIKHAILLAGAK